MKDSNRCNRILSLLSKRKKLLIRTAVICCCILFLMYFFRARTIVDPDNENMEIACITYRNAGRDNYTYTLDKQVAEILSNLKVRRMLDIPGNTKANYEEWMIDIVYTDSADHWSIILGNRYSYVKGSVFYYNIVNREEIFSALNELMENK